MFRTLIYPSSGACDCVVELLHRSTCSDPKFQTPFLTVAEDDKYVHGRKQSDLQMSCRIQCFHLKQDSSKYTDNTNQGLLEVTQRNCCVEHVRIEIK